MAYHKEFEPNADTYLALICAFGTAEEPENVLESFTQMHEAGLEASKDVVEGKWC